jgi:hypothetical protein
MSTILENLTRQLGGSLMGQIGNEIGADRETTERATAAGLTTLLGALSRNASSADGAQALHRALAKDHDGSILDNLGGFLGSAQAGPGEGILRHVLGSRRRRVEAGIGKSTGMDAGSVGKLLTMLAPVVLGALGKQRRQGDLDAGSLASLLGQERQSMERVQPEATGILGQLLDADGDGDVDLGDVAKRGVGMLGKLFGGR